MMSDVLQLESSQELASFQNVSHTHVQLKEKPSIPVVTTAEASSEEMTVSDSPKQPQAGHVTMSLPAPLSTVHVQLPISVSHGRTSIPVLTHSISEPVHGYHNPRKFLTRSKTVRSPPPTEEGTDIQIDLYYLRQPLHLPCLLNYISFTQFADGVVMHVSLVQCNSSPQILWPMKREPVQKIMNTPTTTVNTSFDSCDSGISSELPPRLEAFRQSKSLSRDSSFEYTDSTGTDLHEFIVKTLRNPRDRNLLIKLEKDFLKFTQDPSRLFIQYPQMTSYHRMIVHRVAAYFGMDHNVDQSGKSVIVNKTHNTRIPDLRFVELVSRDESEDSDSAPRSILRRQNTPSDDSTPPKIDSPVTMLTMEDKRSKSIEEREEEYNKARHRIFNQDSLSSQSSQSSLELQFQQPLLREEEEGKPIEINKDRKILTKAQSFDERNLEKTSVTTSDVKVRTTKVLTRSSSSPGISRERLFQQSLGLGSSPTGSRHHVTGSSVAYWPADVMTGGHQLQRGEVQMVPVQAYPGVMAVQAASGPPVTGPATQAGGVMWSIPQDSLQQGAMLYNPATGTPVLGPDGNPVFVQPSYQPVIVKQGPGGTGVAHGQPQDPQGQQPVPQASGQVVAPQYATGIPQPVYVMQQQPRAQYVQQPSAEGVQAVAWPAGATGYPEMTTQFGAMSMGGQQTEVDSSGSAAQFAAGDSSVSVAGPVYMSSVTQAGLAAQHGQVQYVVMPHPGPGQLRQVTDQNTQQAAPAAQQPQTAYIVASHSSYQHHAALQQQYQMTGDTSVMQQPRSQTPPTPPRTSSPVYTSHHYSQPQFVVGSPSHSQQIGPTHVQQAHAPQFQQHPTPQTQTQVMRHTVPFIVPGGRTVPINPSVMHNTPGGPLAKQQGPPPPMHYHVNPVQVQGQYPGGQKRPFNIDRRHAKSSDMYPAEIPVVLPGQSVPSGSAVKVALPYGENIGVVERNQFGQYVHYQRFPPPNQMAGSAGAQFQQGKPKHKHQQHRRGSSPRSQTHHGQTQTPQGTQPQGHGQREHTKSPRQGSRTSTPESERTTGKHVLEIYDLPEGAKNEEIDTLLEDLKKAGAQIKLPTNGSSSVTGMAIFLSAHAAQQACDNISSPNFKLRFIQNLNSLASTD